MNYLIFGRKNITDFSDKNINALYSAGCLFTREDKGAMYETRSVRVDLSKFELSSENRRILRKTENLKIEVCPLPYKKYSWEIGKMGKDFYETKFGVGTFSANKIKELMTESDKSNFNRVVVYALTPFDVNLGNSPYPLLERGGQTIGYATCLKTIGVDDVLTPPYEGGAGGGFSVGYAICLETNSILHYCYPFYSLKATSYQLPTNTGLGMMTRALIWAKEQGKQYAYLGSAKDAAALYKFQFKGVEWWDGKKWQTDAEELKKIL